MIHPAATRHRSDAPLWAITAYFNPCKYRRRYENYLAFRRQLTVPLVTVELSFDGVYALDATDADVLIQLSGGDVMWQKERLLNLALGALPRECEKVAWLDCDVIFTNVDWADAAADALDRHLVIQPFTQSREFSPQVSATECDLQQSQPIGESLAKAVATGRLKPDILLSADKGPLNVQCGIAWAARTELFRRHGFYDACIMGCGDGAIIAGIFGNFQDLIEYLRMNDRRAQHYRKWAEPFHEEVRGNLGYCEGTIYHVWHGERKDRHYLRRRIEFAEFDFDPFRDIAVDESGCWRWSSNKPQMHQFTNDYFSLRLEDGR